MHETRHLDTPEHLRALSDATRVAIVRRLMARPATITQIENAGLVVITGSDETIVAA